jgi:hypothetical protein
MGGWCAVAAREMLEHLQRELQQLGYYDFQIAEIVMETVGKSSLEKLNQEETEKVVQRLTEQLAFARKCLSTRLE